MPHSLDVEVAGMRLIAQVTCEIKEDFLSFVLKKPAGNDIRLRAFREMEASNFRPLKR
jgi:hypothetical protein